MTNTKYVVRVAIPFDQDKKTEPIFHNFVEFLPPVEGQLRCCDEPGVFTVYDTYIEAAEIARKISKFYYIVEVTEYVT